MGIFDSTGAVIDYLNDNMVTLIGSGNYDVTVYRDTFPDISKSEAISVFNELEESTEYTGIIISGMRINTRSRGKQTAYNLIVNVDSLLNLMVGKMLNDTIELTLCKRNSGPTWFRGEDGLHYYTALYGATMREFE